MIGNRLEIGPLRNGGSPAVIIIFPLAVTLNAIVQFALRGFSPIRIIFTPVPIIVVRIKAFDFGHSVVADDILIGVEALQDNATAVRDIAGLIDDSSIDFKIDKDIDCGAVGRPGRVFDCSSRPDVRDIEIIDLGKEIVDGNVIGYRSNGDSGSRNSRRYGPGDSSRDGSGRRCGSGFLCPQPQADQDGITAQSARPDNSIPGYGRPAGDAGRSFP